MSGAPQETFKLENCYSCDGSPVMGMRPHEKYSPYYVVCKNQGCKEKPEVSLQLSMRAAELTWNSFMKRRRKK